MKKIMIMMSVVICALFCVLPAVKVMADDEEPILVSENTAAEPETEDVSKGLDVTSVKAIVAGAVIAAAAVAGALGMAFAIGKAVDSTARQPEAGADIRSSMMLGLVFIETAIIYALIVAILVVFVL